MSASNLKRKLARGKIILVALGVLVVIVSGFLIFRKEVGPVPTMTGVEAAERAERHIQRAVAALPELRLTQIGSPMSVECQDPTDRGPLGRSQFTTRYFLDELPREDNDSNVEAVYQHWIENGYQVLVDDRPDRIFISVQHEDDAFRMSIRASVQGDLSLGASSPCIWPNGTPEPAAP